MSALDTEISRLRRDVSQLDRACRDRYGVSALMFRTAKFVFYISVLVSMAYLVESGVDPFLAMTFAALLITGPEGLEMWLVNQGKLAETQRRTGDDD